MKVFLDVGAHTGETLAAVLRWDFDRIVCFEPAAANLPRLRRLADARTTVEPFGLWDKSCEERLCNPGSDGASLWERPNRPKTHEVCRFVRATDWLRDNLSVGDTVWMKLNVEGAELDVLTDLLDGGEFHRVDFLEIMWDAHKIPALASRLHAVRARIEALYQVPRVMNSKQVPKADTHSGRIDNWLTMTGLARAAA